MKKRIIATALVFSLNIMPMTSNAAYVQPSDPTQTSGTCGKNGADVYWSIDNSGTLTISGSGEMTDYSLAASSTVPWKRSSVKNVVICDGVENVGSYSFYGCKNLVTITLPEGLAYIGDYAFAQSSGLATIIIPNGTESIGESAFSGCTALGDISVPESVSRIGGNAFYNTPWYNTLLSENDVVIINSVLFDGSKAKGSYTVPEGVTYISDNAFRSSGLTDITFCDSVSYIGSSAFVSCTELKEIHIPANVEYIGDNAFGCDKMESITVDADNPNYSDDGGVLFNKDMDELIFYPRGNGQPSYTIPDEVRYIHDKAFSRAYKLTSVDIPDGVEKIGEEAFSYCRGLVSVSIPDSVTSIGTGAFQRCNSLRDLRIGSGITSTGDSAFAYCEMLQNVDMAYGVSTINDRAFYYCTALETITLPDSVSTIKEESFSYCPSLTHVDLGSGIRIIGTEAFSECPKLSDIYFPEGLRTIGAGAFFSCSSLKEVVIPSTVTIINGTSCMSHNLVDGSSYYSYNGAFTACTSLEKVTFLGAPPSIGDSMFSGCTSLKKVTIPEGTDTIESYAFVNCTALEEIEIPSTVSFIGKNVFAECSSLKSVDLPNGLTTLCEGTFLNCLSLERVGMPNNGIKIYSRAFEGCLSLRDIDLTMTDSDIAEDAFTSYDSKAKYSYEIYALSEISTTFYDEERNTIYIKTDNPDPESIVIFTNADVYKKPVTFADMKYLQEDITKYFRQVNGGYVWSFKAMHSGDYRLFIGEKDGNKVSIAAEYNINIKDTDTETERWIDEIIASQTNDSMTNFEKMDAVSKYLLSEFRYFSNDGTYLVDLASCPDAPFFVACSWDSCLSPSVLCQFARKIGGFDEVADLYTDYAQYGYKWSNSHYLCYCRAGDESAVYTACPQSSTGYINYTVIDFSDPSNLYPLKNCEPVKNVYTPITIHGQANSYVEGFAKENGLAFSSEILRGDVNGDGQISTADLVLLERFLHGKGKINSTPRADLCKDGKLDIYDLTMLRKIVISML